MDENGDQIKVEGNFEGTMIQGDRNKVTNNHIDGEKLGQSLGETLSESARSERFWELRRESEREDSRQVTGTMLVSFVSGFAIGACWKLASPWNTATLPFFITGTTILFNVLKFTNFGLRRSLFKIIFINTAFALLLHYTSFIHAWMEINQFVGTVVLATIGAFIGLFVGIVQLFYRPLED